jgi:hypothetical protein
VIAKGTPVICEHCQTKVYELVRNVEGYELIQAEQMADVGFGVPEDGDLIQCPACGEDLLPSLKAVAK